jgi:hypothetical protein
LWKALSKTATSFFSLRPLSFRQWAVMDPISRAEMSIQVRRKRREEKRRTEGRKENRHYEAENKEQKRREESLSNS